MITNRYKLPVLAFAILSLSMLTYSCTEIFGDSDSFVTATINGEEKTWSGIEVNAIEIDTLDGIYVQAVTTNSFSSIEQMSFAIINFDGVGTYNLSIESPIYATYSITGSDNDFEALGNIGEIEVTDFENDVITGKIKFTLQTTDNTAYNLTNGSFKVKISL